VRLVIHVFTALSHAFVLEQSLVALRSMFKSIQDHRSIPNRIVRSSQLSPSLVKPVVTSGLCFSVGQVDRGCNGNAFVK
jgi:hypothetical protein